MHSCIVQFGRQQIERKSLSGIFFFFCHSEFITFLICRCLLNNCIVKYMYMYLEQKFLTAYLILRCTERLSKSEYHLRSFEISYNSTPIKYSILYFPWLKSLRRNLYFISINRLYWPNLVHPQITFFPLHRMGLWFKEAPHVFKGLLIPRPI